MIASDYKVKPRSEADIKRLADDCRRLGGVSNCVSFNIVAFLRRCFRNPCGKKGKLLFAIVEEWHPKDVPYVEYNPLTLVTTQRILNRAELGMAFERFQMAHEVAHIVMHDHHAKAFSSEIDARIKFEMQEFSAEWQANTFAKYFLLPDWIMLSDRSPERIVCDAQVPQPLFEERLLDIKEMLERQSVLFSPTDRQFSLAL